MFVPPDFVMNLEFEEKKLVPLNSRNFVESCQLLPSNVTFSSMFLFPCLADGQDDFKRVQYMIGLPGQDPHPIISKGQRYLHWAFLFAFFLLISRNTGDKNKAEHNSTEYMNPWLDITAIFLIITCILKETNLFLTYLLIGLFVHSYSSTGLPWRQN